MANRIKMVCRDRDCYCKPKKATHSASPPPPAVDLELLQRYVRLRENGKFLNLEINCSDGSSRSVHKFILNSLSVELGRSIQESKYYISIYFQILSLQNGINIFQRVSFVYLPLFWIQYSHQGQIMISLVTIPRSLLGTDILMPKRKYFLRSIIGCFNNRQAFG